MTRRAASFTQADVARALRAMRALGESAEVVIEAGRVIVRPVQPAAPGASTGDRNAPDALAIDRGREIVL